MDRISRPEKDISIVSSVYDERVM